MKRTRLRLACLCLCLAGACSLSSPLLALAGPAEPVDQILRQASRAREAGDAERERAILEQGLDSVGPGNPAAFAIYQVLGQHHADYGNLARAAELAERQLLVARSAAQQHGALAKLVTLYAGLQRRAQAESALRKLEQLQAQLRSSTGWPRSGTLWQARTAWAEAHFSAAQGHLAEAEAGWKDCLSWSEQILRDNAEHESALFHAIDCTAGLMGTQIATGQLAAAGAVADQQRVAIERMVQLAKRPAISARVASVFGRLALEQGRTDDARRIFLKALNSMEGAHSGDSSLRAANLRAQLADVEMLRGQWETALAWHKRREQALLRAGSARGRKGTVTVEYAYTLLRLDRPAEALAMLDRIVTARRKAYDERSLFLWWSMAFRGLALAGNGRRDEALNELKVAIPKILEMMKGERTSSEAGVLRTVRLNWLLDGYIDLLADAARSAAGGAAADEAMDEAFRMADLARGSTVQRALAAATTRANVNDPALADLARKEQDLQREISALSESIDTLLSGGRIAEQDGIVADMRATLTRRREAHAIAQGEIERRFPDYAALLDPRPVGIAAIQKLLKPAEAVVSVHAGRHRTVVWAIPAHGTPAFAVVPLTGEQLDLKVKVLREALDPNAEIAGTLPRFRFDISHALYAQLLAPVEAGWKGAEALIVIPHRGLGQLPMGVLTTAPFDARPARLDYAEMADAPWLIKQIAIFQLPAALALPGLRPPRKGAPAERAFIGFGAPIFATDATTRRAATPGVFNRRNLVIAPASVTARRDAEHEFAPPIDFTLLPQLPDTALEIEEVARVLSADAGRDVFLQDRASEAQVKKTNLSGYRVVMFATHGLMTGEMPGLYQPALALSNPAITGDGEDGMLTMEEILDLRLKANWVILSACNSAAAGEQSGESVSGLGRAFFYAGAKSLLVTNWAVETESARMLTTEAFRRQVADPALPRAKALQQSSLALMRKSAGTRYSYAHPMFWAPYSLVGDGG